VDDLPSKPYCRYEHSDGHCPMGAFRIMRKIDKADFGHYYSMKCSFSNRLVSAKTLDECKEEAQSMLDKLILGCLDLPVVLLP